jgi:hypothetical protein
MGMRITSIGLVALVGTASLSLGAPADAQETAFRIISVDTKECLSLRKPDAPSGGGLELKPCQPSTDIPFSLERNTTGETQIIVKLTTSRFICVVASDEPLASATLPLPVSTKECGGLGSTWFHSGPLDQHVIRKADRAQTPAGCLQVNAITRAIELEVCQAVPRQQWKLEKLN